MTGPNSPSTIRNPQSVRQMFARITPRYDLLNHLLSFQVDRWWRRRVARRFRHVLKRPEAMVLDLCCGTGDLMLALGRYADPSARIVGADFCHPMLQRAAPKLGCAGRPAHLAEADALRLPFANGLFDLVTLAFGFRNLADYGAGLRELLRVLKPGGELGILEFSEPEGALRSLYQFYLQRVLPRIGGAVSGDGGAYQYLARTVADFPSPAQLASNMTETGFTDVRYEKLTGGAVHLHTAAHP